MTKKAGCFYPQQRGEPPPIQRRSRWRRLDAPWLLPSAEGERFRRSGGLPPQARLALPGRGLFAMAWREKLPPSAAGGGRAHGRGQEGKDNQGFLSPLNSPNFPLSRSAEHSRLNGGYGGSVPCVVSLMGRCAALNLLSATCTGSASIKNEALEHQTHLWAPRF